MTMRLLFVFLIFAFELVQVNGLNPLLDCDDGWIRDRRFCYMFVESPTRHNEALAECGRRKSSVSSIWFPDENEFVSKSLYAFTSNSSSLYWIGLYKTSTGTWLWRDTSKLPLRMWAKDEPKPGGCVVMNRATGKWHVRNCTDRVDGFICRRVILRVFEMGYPWTTYQNGENRLESYAGNRRSSAMSMKRDSQQSLDNNALIKTFVIPDISAEWCLVECLAMNGNCVFVEIWYNYYDTVKCYLKKNV